VVSPVEDFLTGTDVNVSWEVLNSGSCDWKANYFIRQVGGPCPEGEIVGGAPDRAIPSGNKGTISAKIELPRQSGNITCSYRLGDGSKLFGATLSMTVTVKKPVLGYP
jgi:hypothetical protein